MSTNTQTQPVVTTSRLPAPAETVWARAVTPEGVNYELRPVMRMTVPRALRGKTIDELPLGTKAGRSWILAFGIVPFEYDDLVIVEHEPGRRFLERSQMLMMKVWEHERTVVPVGDDSCEITDRIAFELRRPLSNTPAARRFVAAFIRRLFAHRHRRLRRFYSVRTPRARPT